jgi:hypothetical protein
MRVAKHLSLPVAEVETTVIGGRKLLVIERYDRTVDKIGAVVRIHQDQEDFCQATGIPPGKKYEEDGGIKLPGAPSPTSVANLLEYHLLGVDRRHALASRSGGLLCLVHCLVSLIYELHGVGLSVALGEGHTDARMKRKPSTFDGKVALVQAVLDAFQDSASFAAVDVAEDN